MYLTVQHLQKAMKNTQNEVEKMDDLLKEQTSIADNNKIHEELKTNIRKMKELNNVQQGQKV